MPRIALDLNEAEDRRQIEGEWRVAPGLVPGEANEGLVARILASPARLTDYDDSGWQTWSNIRESQSVTARSGSTARSIAAPASSWASTPSTGWR